MIVAWSAHTGTEDRTGRAGVNYMMNRIVAKNDEAGQRFMVVRDPPPEILRGNPQLVQRTIKRLRTKLVYSSCVLSFAESDIDVSALNAGDPALRETVERLINEFEETCFAGIPDECRPPTFWTTHTHTGRLELNFLCPRAVIAQKGANKRMGADRPLIGELVSYNPKPPGKPSEALFDALRTAWNAEQGWADPEAASRARDVKVPDHILKEARSNEREGGRIPPKDVREVFFEEMARAVRSGQVSSRREMIATLEAKGYRMSRVGADYISIVSDEEVHDGMPTLSRPIRLKGPLFSEAFDSREAGLRLLGPRLPDDGPRLDPAVARRDYQKRVRRRAEFNRQRYGGPGWADEPFYWSAVPKGPDPLDEMELRRSRRRQQKRASRETPTLPSPDGGAAPAHPAPRIEPLSSADLPRSRPGRQGFKIRLWESLYRVDLPPDLSDHILYVDTRKRSVRLADGVTVTDHGDLLTASDTSRLAARLMVVEAQAKGWPGVMVSGDAEFLRLVAEECVRLDFPVIGKTPEMDEVIGQHLEAVGLERKALPSAPANWIAQPTETAPPLRDTVPPLDEQSPTEGFPQTDAGDDDLHETEKSPEQSYADPGDDYQNPDEAEEDDRFEP